MARLEVADERLDSLAKELSRVIEWVGELEKVDTENIEPLYSPGAAEMRMREDKPIPQDADKVLANAPSQKGRFYMVPKTPEED